MKFKLSVILFGAVFFCLSSMAISAATITVNTLTDENNTNGAACSLREAINNANNDNTASGLGCVAGSGTDSIVISVNGTITPTTVLPTLTTSMNITGNGASLLTISGNNARRVFVINGGTVSINDLTVTNGFNSIQAGAISNEGSSTTTLAGLVITNSNSGQGGGIQNDATMTINNSTVSNNQATSFFGGGIANYGTLTISGSTISGNQGSAQGGGINNINGSLTVTDSTFTGNSTPNLGGAITNNNGTLFNITRSTFTGNSAGEGAALYMDSPNTSTITNNTFFNNTGNLGIVVQSGTTVTMNNCTMSGNRANGGAVRLTSGSATLINNIIAGNTNNSGTTQADINLAGGTVVTGSSFNNIIGTGGAGGLTNGVNGNQTNIAFANVGLLPLGNYGGLVQTMPIRTNSPALNAGRNTGAPATDARGYSRSQGGSVDIGSFELQANSIVTTTFNNATGSLRDVIAAVPANEIVQFGVPLFNTARTITLTTGQITISKNLTIYGYGANILNVQNTQAQGTTSRVFDISSDVTVNLTGMTISGGNVVGSGGAINTANSSLVTINGCHITGNTSTNFGGGIFSRSVLNILNSTVSANISNNLSATGSGSGINNSSGGTLNLTNSTVSGNSATGGDKNGGVWSHSGAVTTITNSTITDNVSAGSNSASGLFNDGGSVTVRNSIIAANQNNATVPDVSGTFTSGGFNLIGNRGTAVGFTQPTDITGTSPLFENVNEKSLAPSAVVNPSLLPLALNGGTVPTHSPRGDSLVIDKGNSFGSTTDARGLLRPVDLPGFANAAGGDGADIGAYEFQFAPTSANVSISGRVLTASGAGLTNAIVYLTDSNGTTRTVKTGSFGNYLFEELTSGETYTISIVSRRYQFAPRIVNVNASVTDFDFTAID